MKTILTTMLILVAFNAKSQIFFKNNYSEPVWVALGYPVISDSYKGWMTVGWFKILPGEKKEILSYNPLGQYIYYYAQTNNANKVFEGNTNLLLDPVDSFNIKNADKSYVKEENSNFVWKKFREIDKGGADIIKLKYTIEFDY